MRNIDTEKGDKALEVDVSCTVFIQLLYFLETMNSVI